MWLLLLLVRLGIHISGIPVRVARAMGSAIIRRFLWLGPMAQKGLSLAAGARSNSLARVAILLSIINFGFLMWQAWPEGTRQTIAPSRAAAENLETFRFEKTASRATELEDRIDITAGKIIELENRIRDLSREQEVQIDRLRDCINYPSPFGCRKN